jgi:hypothetical protein
MPQYLKSKDDGKLLSVTGGKVFVVPAEVIKKDISASFLNCVDEQGAEQLVYITYTKTGEFSERNTHVLITGNAAEEAEILFNNVQTSRATPDFEAQYAELASQAIIEVRNTLTESDPLTAEQQATVERIAND